MTDKEKIRKEVEIVVNRRLNLLNGDYFDLNKEVDGFTNEITDIIDSIQEKLAAPKVLENMLNAKTAAENLGISQEEHNRIIDELIYGKEPELVDIDDFLNKEEDPVSEKKCMFTKDSYTDFLSLVDKEARELWKEINSGNDFSIVDSFNQFYGICMQVAESTVEWQKNLQEPVSEDYDNALHSEALTFLQEQQIAPNLYADIIIRAVKHGAKWQKKKDDEEKVLTYKHGFEDCKEHINKILLSEVLPCFMHGGEADEVVAKLDKVLNRKK